MADTHTAEHRSWNMSRIRNKNTKPEKKVRALLHRMGYRFSLHRKDLPRRPDIVMPKPRTVIFVHGCIWHGHVNCAHFRLPKTRRAWWKQKIWANQARDLCAKNALRATGWKVVIAWECALKKRTITWGTLPGSKRC
jgi:DNA mismatch endonuclease (patch repair protein)